MKGNSKLNFIITGIIIIGVFILIIWLYTSTTKETKYVLSEDSVIIEGMYGITCNYSDITSVELKDIIPNVLTKTNGSAIGEVRKGFFELEGLGKCRLFTFSWEGPYLYINTKDGYIILNQKDKNQTEKLYQDLSEKITK